MLPLLLPLLLPQEHLRGEALKTNELLRHLWACLPLASAPRAEAAARLCRHLAEQRGTLAAHMAAHPGERACVLVLRCASAAL